MDFLFGLDMLRRYRGAIDLKDNVLRMHTGETTASTPFLSEADIPQSKRLTSAADLGKEDEDMQKALQQSADMEVDGGNGASSSSSAAAAAAAPVPAAAPAPAAAPVAPPAPAGADQLVALGFPADRAVLALQACGGSVDNAAAMLFAESDAN